MTVMGRRSTHFLCCDAHTWCQAIAWLEMVGGVLGGLICGMMINVGSNELDNTKTELDRAIAQGFIVTLWAFLVHCAFMFFFGLMLMLGTTQRNVCFLWTWIVLTSVGILFSLGWLFSGGSAGFIILILIDILLESVFVYATVLRAKEISAQEASGATVCVA